MRVVRRVETWGASTGVETEAVWGVVGVRVRSRMRGGVDRSDVMWRCWEGGGGDGEDGGMCGNLGGIDWVGNCGGVWGTVGVRVRSRMRDRGAQEV